jgi:trans-aconitate 2-methyltransferase
MADTNRPSIWDPEQYGRFADERAQPFFELVANIPIAPRRVVDLGCGPGTLTASLLARWPDSTVVGVDNSPEMLERARPLTESGRLTFELGDIAAWRAAEPVDLILSNAAFHWVPTHRRLFQRFASMLASPGVLAFQVPGNFGEPSHTLVAELCRTPRWQTRLGEDGDVGGAPQQANVAHPVEYLNDLVAAGFNARVWEATYLHVLQGENPVLEWIKGTALRPILSRLQSDEQEEFTAELAPMLRQAYPADAFGTVMPFRRIFAVASTA